MIKISYEKDTGKILNALDESIEVEGDYIIVNEKDWAEASLYSSTIVDGKLVISEDEKIKKSNQKEKIDLENYLINTDWYVARFSETGKEIPEEIKVERQRARERISEIKNT